MQQRVSALLAVLVAVTVGLAGCSSSSGGHKHDAVNCPDGQMVPGSEIGAIPGHDSAGFNATDACPESPSVTLTGLPASLNAYQVANFTWSVNNASVPKGHSMLSSLRWSPASISPSALTGMEAYPNELLKREHQELPVTFEGTLSFTEPGTVYVRAYSQIQGEDYNRTEFWSPEIRIDILAVEPTGKVVDITYAVGGDINNGVTPTSIDIVLGDAVRLVNNDPRAHTCSTSTVGNPGNITAAGQTTGTGRVFTRPATYEYVCDGVQPRAISIRAFVPA